MPTAPPTITPFPGPAPTRADPDNFDDRAEAAFGAMPTFADEIGDVADNVYANAQDAEAAALTAVNAPGTSATSTSNVAIGTGNKSFVTQTGKAFVVGMFVTIAHTGTPANWMTGQITAYNSGTGALDVNVTRIGAGASGTQNAWTIAIAPPDLMTLLNPTIDGAITEDTYTIPDSGAVIIDPRNGSIQKWILGANRTPTVANFAVGDSVFIKIADGAAYSVTWTSILSAADWVWGAAPTLPTTGYGGIILWRDADGYHGAYTGAFA